VRATSIGSWRYSTRTSSRGPISGRRGSRETRGAAAVARQALGYAQLGLDMRPALINGVPGGVAFLHGQPFSIGAVTVPKRQDR
jgi:hypothetical protein